MKYSKNTEATAVTSVRISKALLAKAKKQKLNLSQVLKDALEREFETFERLAL